MATNILLECRFEGDNYRITPDLIWSKNRVMPDLNWSRLVIQKWNDVSGIWEDFSGPSSIAKQVFKRMQMHLIGNEVEAEPACNKPSRCFQEYINDSSPDVAPQIDPCEERTRE